MGRRRRDPVDAIRALRRSLASVEPFNRLVTRGLHVRESASPAGEWLVPDGDAAERAILYVHGGGYVVGSPLSHRRLTTALVRESRTRAFVVRYRLAPEHPFPAALDDVVAAFDALVASGIPPAGIVLAGDSAGGGLVLSAGLVLAARGERESPAGIIAYSPWSDLAATGASIRTNARRDDMLAGDRTAESARFYVPEERSVRDPRASALYGDLTGFPPTLIFASECEILRDDATRFAARARDAGAPVDLILEPGMPHVWPIFYDVMPEAKRTIAASAAYVIARLQRVSSTSSAETIHP